jgi:hypothetical protein
MENRNGLLVDLRVSRATGRCEREAAKEMLKRQRRKGVKVKSLGTDKGYDTEEFVRFLRGRKILPHVAAKKKRLGNRSANYSPSELQSTDSQKARRDLRMDENRGRV